MFYFVTVCEHNHFMFGTISLLVYLPQMISACKNAKFEDVFIKEIIQYWMKENCDFILY